MDHEEKGWKKQAGRHTDILTDKRIQIYTEESRNRQTGRETERQTDSPDHGS